MNKIFDDYYDNIRDQSINQIDYQLGHPVWEKSRNKAISQIDDPMLNIIIGTLWSKINLITRQLTLSIREI